MPIPSTKSSAVKEGLKANKTPKSVLRLATMLKLISQLVAGAMVLAFLAG